MDDLKKRCERFIDELGVTVVNFCKHIELSVGGWYAWKAGTLKLSDATLARIEDYLNQYGF